MICYSGGGHYLTNSMLLEKMGKHPLDIQRHVSLCSCTLCSLAMSKVSFVSVASSYKILFFLFRPYLWKKQHKRAGFKQSTEIPDYSGLLGPSELDGEGT